MKETKQINSNNTVFLILLFCGENEVGKIAKVSRDKKVVLFPRVMLGEVITEKNII